MNFFAGSIGFIYFLVYYLLFFISNPIICHRFLMTLSGWLGFVDWPFLILSLSKFVESGSKEGSFTNQAFTTTSINSSTMAATRTQALSHFRRILKEVHLQYTHPKELLGKELTGKGLLGINVHSNKVWTDALKDTFRNNASETDPVKLNKLNTDGEDLALYLESQRRHKVLTTPSLLCKARLLPSSVRSIDLRNPPYLPILYLTTEIGTRREIQPCLLGRGEGLAGGQDRQDGWLRDARGL